MQFAVLASGSSGNCTYITAGGRSILLDAGISCKQIVGRLGALGVDPASLEAVCLSHDHADHVAGVDVLTRKYGLPVYATEGTYEATAACRSPGSPQWHIVSAGNPFTVAGIRVTPFSTPHDAADSLGFVFEHGGDRLGYATDLGMVTTAVKHHLGGGCGALVVESNHDVEMLRNSGRPWSVCERIRGRRGHLSNEQCLDFLKELFENRDKVPPPRRLVLAHLSQECNNPDLVRNGVKGLARACGVENDVEVYVASPEPSPLFFV